MLPPAASAMRSRPVPKSALIALLLALALQGLLLANFGLVFYYNISLRGEGLEIVLLSTTTVVSLWALFQVSWSRSPRWLKSLYALNCIALLLLPWIAMLMGLGFYAVDPLGTFESPSGTQITLNNHAGIVGRSIEPYRIVGLIE